MTAPIGVAIIGGGLFVKEQHLPAVLACKLLSLKAIFSRSLKSAKEAADLIPSEHAHVKPDLYSSDAGHGKSYSDLLKRRDISAVIIALPIVSQTKFIVEALQAGMHVLAEKPVAKDVETAKALHRISEQTRAHNGATLAIAENCRFYNHANYVIEQANALGGRISHFSVRVLIYVNKTDKYYHTEWRKIPDYQGGFLLDGGVHFAAATWLLLSGGGEANKPVSVQAISRQAQEHLPPIDTVNAVIQLKGGGTGIFHFSMGTHLHAFEWEAAYEGGNLKLAGNTVTVTPRGGEPIVKEFERTSGVKEEVDAWANGIIEGKPHPRQSLQEAYNDLELLEKMFRSGEENGAPKKYEFM